MPAKRQSKTPGIGPGDRLVLVDGSNFLHRAFHALPPLTRKSDGFPVGAVSGICGMLLRQLPMGGASPPPTHMAVAFDVSSKTFRNKIYPDYKANRAPLDPELREQFPVARRAVEAFSIPCVELQDYEADDIIATYARQAEAAGAEVVLLSSDKDLMQLVSERVVMQDTMKDRVTGPKEVREKFGVGPEQMVDFQALAGDSSDNIPGAPGIGLKTAAVLLETYGDLETLLARAEEITKPKQRETLLEKADQIRMCRELVTLDTDTPVPVPIGELRLHAPDREDLLGFLNEMEFRTITNRVAAALDKADGAPQTSGKSSSQAPAAATPATKPKAAKGKAATAGYECVRTQEQLAVWAAQVEEFGRLAVDIRTDSTDEMATEIIGVAIGVTAGTAAYIPVGHRRVTSDEELFEDSEALAADQLELSAVLDFLRKHVTDPAVLTVGHNLKHVGKVLAQHDIRIAAPDDTQLMSFALAAGLHRHDLTELTDRYLGETLKPLEELVGKGRSRQPFAATDPVAATEFAAVAVDMCLRLWELFRTRLAENRATRVYETLERPLIGVLIDMDRVGIKIDPKKLRQLSQEFGGQAGKLEAKIHRRAGEKFNIGSPQQLGRVLFDELGIPPPDKSTKSGQYQTGADVLEDLAYSGEEIARHVLDWRHLTKLKGTYTDPLPEHVNPQTGRVHTSLLLANATTGRLASMEPNLQNIPIRTDEGRRIRAAFVADKGKVLLSLDYSQIELRVLAHWADIPVLSEAFHAGLDIHARTASEVFGVPIEDMDPATRRRAKAINFGIIYGISGYGLARQLNISREEARDYIQLYFKHFPGIRDYMEATKETARRLGYVETLFGRRIHTPNIRAKGPARAYQERAAINAPIQGSAADIIRRAMVRIPPALAAAGEDAKMLLQVHDELLFEVPKARVQAVQAIASQIMETAAEPAVTLSVPVVVDAGVGPNWDAAH